MGQKPVTKIPEQTGWLMQPNDITVPVPCYNMAGKVWHEDEVPNGTDIEYHLDQSDSVMWHYIPTHARQAVKNYRETLRLLLFAGF